MANNNNWRNFGGIYKSEKLSHISVGTLVADQVLLRQTQSSVLIVQGGIDIGADAIIRGNLFTFENSYFHKNLYFGTQTAYDSSSQSVYLTGNSSGIGINVDSPQSTFEIMGTTNNTAFMVRSSTTSNNNIIAQNKNKKGIHVSANDASSSITFYNSSASYPDSAITNALNGNNFVLDFSASSLRVNPRAVTNSLYDESVVIYDASRTPYLYNVYQDSTIQTGSTLTLVSLDNSSNTVLRLVSPNKNGLFISGGGKFPFDNSRNYGTIGVTDQKPALTVVSGNSVIKYKSTMGINTFSPKTENYVLDVNGPIHIGNGELDTVGIFSFDASFVSFSKRNNAGIISGGPSTLSTPYQNTVAYTMNNGLTWTTSIIDKTTSGTIAILQNPFSMCCYSYDPSYAFVGCTASYSPAIQPNINAIYYTNNGGATWAKMNDTVGLAYQYTINCIYAVDNPTERLKRVFFAGVASAVHNNSSSTSSTVFYVDVLNSTLDAGGDINFSMDENNANHVTGFSPAFTVINACDGSGNDLYYVGNGIQHVSVNSNVADMAYNIGSSYNYNNVCYYDSSHVIAVGTGIISATTDGLYWIDVSYTYDRSPIGNIRDVFIYDTSRAIAVGNNGTALYSTNGYKDWKTIPTQILNSSGIGSLITNPNYDLTGVVMPDINTFVFTQVTQKYSPILSKNGSSKILYGYFPSLFNAAANNVLDISGNMTIGGNITIAQGGQLNTNQVNLSGDIIPTMGNVFNLGTAAKPFSSMYINKSAVYFTDSSNQPGLAISALSYNADISGMQLKTTSDGVVGNVVLSYGGNVALGKLTKTPSYTVDISGILNVNSTLRVNADTSANTRLFVGGDVSLNRRLNVIGNTTLTGLLSTLSDISANGNLKVNGNTNLNSQLTVTGNTNLNSQLFVTGNTNLTSPLNANSDIYANSRLFVTNDASFNRNTYTAGNVTVNQNIIGNGTLTLTKDATFNGNTYTGLAAYSPVFDSNSSVLNIGTQSNSTTIYIGNFNNTRPKTINIGSPGDTVIFSGDVTNTTTIPIIVEEKYLILNKNQGYNETGTARSFGSGLYIRDNSNDMAGYFLVSTDMSGYNFKAPNIESNNIRLDVNTMMLNGTTNTGLVVLKRSAQMGILDSSYAVTVQNIDVSSLLIRSSSLSTDATQVISSNVTIQNDLSLNSRLFVSNDVSLNGNLFVGKTATFTFVSINGLNVQYDISLNGRLFVGSDVSLSSRLFVNNDVSANSRLFVGQDTSLNSRLFVGQDTSLNSRLYVAGNTILNQGLTALSDVSAISRLFVGQDTSLNSRLYVAGNTILNQGLTTLSDISANSRLFVGQDTSLNNRLYVAGNTILNQGLTALSDISANTRLFVNGDVSLNSRLYINNDISAISRLFVGQDTSLNSRLYVAGNTILNQGLTTLSDISANARLFVNGDVSLKNRLYVNNDISAISRLFVGQDTSLNSRLNVAGNTILNQGLTTLSDISANARLFVNGDVSLNNRLYVNNDISAISRLFVGQDTSLNNRLYVAGNTILNQGLTALSDISANTRLFVNGDVSLNSRLYVNSDISANSRLFVGLDTSLNSRLFVGLDTSLNSRLNVAGNTILNQGLTALSDISANTRLFVNGDVSLNSRLYVNNDISANSRLFVGQDTSLNSRLYVTGNTILNKGLTALSDISANKRLFVGGDVSLNGFLFVNNDVSANGNVFVGMDTNVNGNLYVAQNLTMGGVVNFVGLSIGSNVNYPDTTFDISGNIEQLNGAIYQF